MKINNTNGGRCLEDYEETQCEDYINGKFYLVYIRKLL